MMTSQFNGPEYDVAPGDIIGLRSFDIDAFARLHSVHRDYTWHGGRNTASCDRVRRYDVGRCKNTHCTCGFYAYHDGTEHEAGQVRGVIKAWGKTTIGTQGFRAEYAEIVALSIRPWVPAKYELAKCYAATLAIPVLAIVSLTVGLPDAIAGVIFAIWVMCLAVMTGMVVHLMTTKTPGISPLKVRTIKARYPDVKLYFRHEKMLRDWPPSYTVEEVW